MIEVRHVTRRYGDFAAVDDVSFSIAPGEVVGLLGHNGAGKTTIMKMLTGYLEPSSGTILVDGIDVAEDPIAAQLSMGYLPENLPLYPELTVVDYLSHAAQLRRLEPADCVPRAIRATQLREKALDRIDTLSRGYKQRLGVAQAILHEPRFLILDEPSNGLDPNQIREMRALIRSVAEHATVILSTHIMQEVNAVCDRALILRGGRLVVDEKLADLQSATAAKLSTAPDVRVDQLLQDAAGAERISQVQPGVWTVPLHGDQHAGIAELTRRLVAAGVPIYEIAPAVRDLESVFAEANETDAVRETQEVDHAA